MKIAGKQKFLSQIAALPAAMRTEIQKALVVSAEETNDLQQRFVPVDKGDLKRSIGYVLGDEVPEGAGISTAPAKGSTDLTVTMFAGNATTIVTNKRGVEFQNAVLQEFGTKKMSANPFFFPGFRIGKKRAKPRLARAVSAGAKKAFRK
ncbi:HK97 gp10 family phage protein [Mesorhizobium sp. B2-1-3A]|uniref:HK97 gp10 family phage protein n=1 Tax=Mesorhizobium sp. B2-1-3A TaxID=2589971 RepID=UPI00112BF036|nr:HK97 gp10 family phage protein [Mesorhizobium sp. B2-1-3A]TPM92726.1 HK97 gp10 family phage protein [Mesorhizobium sp. B2-1-3A]